jgi:predicted tellurium resistance membrane protein TerC
MEQILNLDNLVSLGLLILLQAVLGFDNLLYISLESKRAPAEKQATVRRLGIGIAIVLRIVLLLALMKLIQFFRDPVVSIHFPSIIEGKFNLHSIIVLLGGVFIIYTSIREIFHMIGLEDLGKEEK